MVTFPPVSPPRTYTPLSPHPYAPHVQPISFFSILSPAQYWVRSTDHLAPRYAIFSIPPITSSLLTTYHHPVPLSRNLGILTSWKPQGLSRSLMGLLYIYIYIYIYIFLLLVEMSCQSDVQLRGCLFIHLLKTTSHNILLCDTLSAPLDLYPVISMSAAPPPINVWRRNYFF